MNKLKTKIVLRTKAVPEGAEEQFFHYMMEDLECNKMFSIYGYMKTVNIDYAVEKTKEQLLNFLEQRKSDFVDVLYREIEGIVGHLDSHEWEVTEGENKGCYKFLKTVNVSGEGDDIVKKYIFIKEDKRKNFNQQLKTSAKNICKMYQREVSKNDNV